MDLTEVLRQHKKWLFGKGGELADLSGADLLCANLRCADLSGADLSGAKLDAMYENIPTSLEIVARLVLANVDKLEMGSWHSDEGWHNGNVHDIHTCGTTHCLAGFAHMDAATKRPELLDEKVNVELVGRLALGEEAASHFYDTNDECLEWLRKDQTNENA